MAILHMVRKWLRLPEALSTAGLALVGYGLWGYDPRLACLVIGAALLALGLGIARAEAIQ